jgi:hypothetical protein
MSIDAAVAVQVFGFVVEPRENTRTPSKDFGFSTLKWHYESAGWRPSGQGTRRRAGRR